MTLPTCVILDPINDTFTLLCLNYTKHSLRPLTKYLNGNSVSYTCKSKLSIEQIFSSIAFDVNWDSHQQLRRKHLMIGPAIAFKQWTLLFPKQQIISFKIIYKILFLPYWNGSYATVRSYVYSILITQSRQISAK